MEKYTIVRPHFLKLLKGDLGSMLQLIGTNKDFLNKVPVAQEIKPTTNK